MMNDMQAQPAPPPAAERAASGYGGNFFGVYTAVVTGLRNPEGGGMGQIQLRFPWLGNDDLVVWARYAAMMAGANRGAWFLPDVGDEVLVAFEAGNVRRPYVLGALWNGADKPPETIDSKQNNPVRSITTRNGIRLTLEDVEGGGTVSIETPGGRTLLLSDGPHGGTVTLEDDAGNSVAMTATGLAVRASSQVTVEAARVSVKAGMVDLDTGMCRVSGVLQCDTMISNAVVSSSYTPGAGNVW